MTRVAVISAAQADVLRELLTDDGTNRQIARREGARPHRPGRRRTARHRHTGRERPGPLEHRREEERVTTKTYPIGVALSVASGKLLCQFDDLHGMVTDLAGWPVYTHHLGSERLVDGAAQKVIRQVPWMPGAIENMPSWDAVPREDREAAIKGWLQRLAEAHGETVTIELGEPLPFMGVLDGLERLGANRR